MKEVDPHGRAHPSRLVRFDALCQSLRQKRSWETAYNVVFLLELDDFRDLRAQYGPAALEALSRQAEELLASLAGEGRVAARLGDALFLLAAHDLGGEAEGRALGWELFRALTLSVPEGRAVTVSVGAAPCRHDPLRGYRCAFQEAMAALEEARSQGGHRLVFRGGEAERSAPWRVMIVEDQELVRLHFASLVQSSPAYQLLYSIRNADLVDVYCEGGEVDLILMDVYTEQGADGLAAAGRIKARFPRVRIIIVTSMPEVSWLDRARAAGVDSFWYKEVHRSSLLELMDRTMAGESVYPDKTPPVPLGQVSSEDLSRRELEILRQILSGDTNEEIARRLFISPATVKTHISSLLQKTGFKSRTELAIRARESELVIW